MVQGQYRILHRRSHPFGPTARLDTVLWLYQKFLADALPRFTGCVGRCCQSQLLPLHLTPCQPSQLTEYNPHLPHMDQTLGRLAGLPAVISKSLASLQLHEEATIGQQPSDSCDHRSGWLMACGAASRSSQKRAESLAAAPATA
jgi:hypothetical protein